MISIVGLGRSCLYNAPHFFRRDWLLITGRPSLSRADPVPSPSVSPVIKINRFTRAGRSLCSRRSSAGPSRSGILTSLKMRSKERCSSSANGCSPSQATSTANPSRSNISTGSRSSSTTRAGRRRSREPSLDGDDWQSDLERRAAARCFVDLDRATRD
jgi:hypothetical protein